MKNLGRLKDKLNTYEYWNDLSVNELKLFIIMELCVDNNDIAWWVVEEGVEFLKAKINEVEK